MTVRSFFLKQASANQPVTSRRLRESSPTVGDLLCLVSSTPELCAAKKKTLQDTKSQEASARKVVFPLFMIMSCCFCGVFTARVSVRHRVVSQTLFSCKYCEAALSLVLSVPLQKLCCPTHDSLFIIVFLAANTSAVAAAAAAAVFIPLT